MALALQNLSGSTTRVDDNFFDRCGNNYGWVRFEGSRCTEYSQNTYGPCADVDRSGFTFPVFEYCHINYDSSPSSEDVYTGGNDICGDRSVVGNTVIGELFMTLA